MTNGVYYGRIDEANRQPPMDVQEQASRADYHRLLDVAARDREAFQERLHDAARERKEAEREERQRAQSLHWQQLLDRPATPRSAAAGRQSTAVMIAGFALAGLGVWGMWTAVKLQQRAGGPHGGEGAGTPSPDPTPEG